MNWIAWLIVLVLLYIFVENPLQPAALRDWRRERKARLKAKEQGKLKKKGPVRYWIDFVFSMVLFLFVFRAMVVEAYRIPSGSMEKTLLVGDFLLVNKFVYGSRTPDWVGIPFSRTGFDIPYFTLPAISDPTPGDVIVFKYPHDPLTNYIKRLVAGPGQTIRIEGKKVFVDDAEFKPYPHQQFVNRRVLAEDEAQYGQPIWPRGSNWNIDWWGPITVPAKDMTITLSPESWMYYRDAITLEGHQLKSPSGGGFSIDGRPATSYTFEQDHYFMLGDNRDQSADSRFWGFVPEKNIVGKAWMIYFSFDVKELRDEFWKVIRWPRLLRMIH
jgi:signal peptidase I